MNRVMNQEHPLIKEISNLLDNCVHKELYSRYVYLNNGYYSTVLRYYDVATNTEYAIKLGGEQREDDGGCMWAEFCLDHQHLDAIPKIMYYRLMSRGKYVLVMEHLEESTSEMEEYANAILNRKEWVEDEPDEDGDYDGHYEEVDWSDRDIPQYILDFIEAFDEVRDAGCIDLHSENYMTRESDGCMVIIDPFSTTHRRTVC